MHLENETCGYCSANDPEEVINCFASNFGNQNSAYYRWSEPPKRNRRGHFDLCIPVKTLNTFAKKRGVLLSEINRWLDIEGIHLPLNSKETPCYIFPLTPDREWNIRKMRGSIYENN